MPGATRLWSEPHAADAASSPARRHASAPFYFGPGESAISEEGSVQLDVVKVNLASQVLSTTSTSKAERPVSDRGLVETGIRTHKKKKKKK